MRGGGLTSGGLRGEVWEVGEQLQEATGGRGRKQCSKERRRVQVEGSEGGTSEKRVQRARTGGGGKYTVRIMFGTVNIIKRNSKSGTALECQP